MANGNGFTKTQARIFEVVRDGLPHQRTELLAAMEDTESTYRNVAVHVVAIRKLLRPKGQDIICELRNRRIYYRYVRLMHSPYDGKR